MSQFIRIVKRIFLLNLIILEDTQTEKRTGEELLTAQPERIYISKLY